MKPKRDKTGTVEQHERLQAEIQDLSLLSDFDLAMATLEPDELVQDALAFLSRQLNSARCSMALYQPDDDSFVVYAATGDREIIPPGRHIPAGHSAISEVAQSRQPLYRPDIAAAGSGYPVDAMLLKSGILADYIVPLIHGKQILGTLNLGSQHIDGISARVQKLAQRLAPRLAAALNSAFVYQQLQRSEARLKGYLQHAPLGVFVVDAHGRYLDVNPRGCALVGYSRDELLQMDIAQIAHAVSSASLGDAMQTLIAGEEYVTDTQFRRKDGTLIDVRVHAAPAGEQQYVGYVVDLREQRRAEMQRQEAERQVMQSQKLESLGVLAGGIAHDFNNLLTSILGHADLALLDAKSGTELHSSLSEILQTARRAADLSGQMLAYSGKGHFVIEAVEINALIQSMLPLLGVAISKRHRLDLQLSATPLTVEADVAQMRQVLMNLVLNASESMRKTGGCIELVTRPVQRDPWTSRYIHTGQKLPAGPYVEITVHDQGEGMSEETLDRLFEPFFSTKFTGRGLGLATVHGIVRGHRGDIEVSSEADRGSTLRVLLPLSDAAGEVAGVASQPPRPAGDEPLFCVLVIDDEKMIRYTTRRMLQRVGHRVVTADSAEHAIAMMEQGEVSPDLALIDLTLSGISGIHCARQIRARWPTVQLLICSGVSQQEFSEQLDVGEVYPFIQKPFGMDDLREALERVMRQR